MKKLLISAVMAMSVVAMSAPAFATNGTNIIGVGTISRSMGGVGAAAPQDAISAVFANPAAMCYIPCETSEVDFAGTVFDPTIKATFSAPGLGVTTSATSKGAPYAFPAIGIYTPINEKLRFGLAAYGVSGLGVDFKDTDLARIGVAAGFTAANTTDIRTQLAIMKFAPNLAYMITPNFSVGAALQINWAQLDLGDGDSHDFGFGTQIGLMYKRDAFSMGLTYQSPQSHKFKRVANFNHPDFIPFGLSRTDLVRDTLELEQPQQVVLGLAYDIIPNMLLVEVDGKWLNWGGAAGYEDFDWEDQWVVAVGAQVKPVDWLAIRAGYNYGNNPVKEHNGWLPGGAPGTAEVNLQGTPVNRFFYEYLRTVGFPAIVTNHVTAGIGVNISPKVSLNLGYMHAFENEMKETANPGVIGPVTMGSTLSENSYEFGVNIMF